MKWHETPIGDLYESALLALARNDEDTYRENLIHAVALTRQREFQTIGIPNGASTVYKESIPLSDDDKARAQLKDNGELLHIYLLALLIADEDTYHMISDDDLLKYLKGAVRRFKHLQASRALAYRAADEGGRLDRHLREMRRCNRVICRIQLERTRRIVAEVDAKLRE